MEGEAHEDEAVELAALFVHELRKPLSAIVFALDAIAARTAVDPGLAALQARLDRNVDRMVGVLDELVTLVTAIRGNAPVPMALVRLDTLLDEARAEVQALIDERALRLEVDVPPALPALRANASASRRALVHVLRNAAASTERGGQVALSLASEQGRLSIVLRHGPAVSALEPATRWEAHRRVVPGDLGLGLTLVRAVVQLHGGELRIGPETDDGSALRLTLPLEPPGAAEQRARRCLFVRREDATGRMIDLLLGSWGFELVTATDQQEAAARAREHDPAIVLVDLENVGGDAGPLVEELVRTASGALRFVAFGEGTAPPGARHLPKPPDPDRLQAALRE